MSFIAHHHRRNINFLFYFLSDPHDYGAVDYNLWRYLGNEILIQSVRGDWLFCKSSEKSSNYVEIFPSASTFKKRPSIYKLDCQIVKTELNLASDCLKTPQTLAWNRNGLVMTESSILDWAVQTSCVDSSIKSENVLFYIR